MKNIKIVVFALLLTVTFVSCETESIDTTDQTELTSLTSEAKLGNPFLNQIWVQEDQVARPAINTVFTPSGRKDEFNVTIPFNQGDIFQPLFEERLLALNDAYSTNLLELDAAAFTGVLATDVLNISLVRPTTFFQSLDLFLTGRTLSDDVIDVELILIFGGPDGSANPGLTSDNVDSNDKEFLNKFPYLASPHLN